MKKASISSNKPASIKQPTLTELKIEQVREEHKKNVLNQLSKAGFRCTRVYETPNAHKILLGSENQYERFMQLGALDLKVYPDYWQVFTIHYEKRTQIYIQPYSGAIILPGEHHLVLKGTLPYPIELKKFEILGGARWYSSDKSYAKMLNQKNEKMGSIGKKVNHTWTKGLAVIRLEWLVQVYHIGHEISKIVIKTGQYNDEGTAYDLGFETQLQLIDAIDEKLMYMYQKIQLPLAKPTYEKFANQLLREVANLTKHESELKYRKSDFLDYQSTIRNIIQPYLGKDVFLEDIPEKREARFRKYVMPENFSTQRIVAAFDSSFRRSGKAGMVFTPTHFFAKEGQLKVALELDDVIGVDVKPFDMNNEIELRLTSGNVKVPVAWFHEIRDVFIAIIELKYHTVDTFTR